MKSPPVTAARVLELLQPIELNHTSTLVLGSDIASKTGWGIIRLDNPKRSVFGTIKHQTILQYYADILGVLRVAATFTDTVIGEQPHVKHKRQQQANGSFEEIQLIQPFGALKRLCALWELACAQLGFHYTEMQAAQWRAQTIGPKYSRASRETVKAAAIWWIQSALGIKATEDEAEALLISFAGATHRQLEARPKIR